MQMRHYTNVTKCKYDKMQIRQNAKIPNINNPKPPYSRPPPLTHWFSIGTPSILFLLYFGLFIYVIFAFCHICILLHLHYVSFAFCLICILSGLHFVSFAFCYICNMSVLHFVRFAFCRVFFAFCQMYILSGYQSRNPCFSEKTQFQPWYTGQAEGLTVCSLLIWICFSCFLLSNSNSIKFWMSSCVIL